MDGGETQLVRRRAGHRRRLAGLHPGEERADGHRPLLQLVRPKARGGKGDVGSRAIDLRNMVSRNPGRSVGRAQLRRSVQHRTT
jgi:hypothetical protein